MHKLFRRAAGWVLAAAVLAGAGMYALRRALPDTFTVQPGQLSSCIISKSASTLMFSLSKGMGP